MAKSSLVNKKVLLIAPSFFSYSERISSELERKGAIVTVYDERPSNSFLFKIIFRLGFLKKIFAKNIINNHFDHIYSNFCQDSFDYILIINPECTPVDFISKVKEVNADCKTIVYMWDSVINKPSSEIYIDAVDCFYSFDKRDCSDKVFFQPLFYSNDTYSDDDFVETYDFSFVGTLHGNRKAILKNIVSQHSDSHHFIYGFYHNRTLHVIKKLLTLDFISRTPFNVQFKPLSYNKYLKSLSESKVVIDLPSQSQTGLTMRSIEVLGLKKKLITTNKDIVNYDFYNPKNILVIGSNRTSIPFEFLSSDYENIDKDIYERYNISSWVDSIFGVNNV
ncbi:hypothetical protein [Vibrio crassostreae]|uniref:hypothetical protein n=1 Tax=Vibrio crassostreae TaxID=246167 RepID=UPI00104AF9EF|nr:hypothetical protein [Vibrio crassostreae]TCN93853.1 hypothetical protein EDB51_1216 [Vibrio crassostreae]CAK2011138.1 Lipopolysaccharide biosynthesis protein [Vibrio crassostreae]CAK2015680.1 Lipopolysaccharide biosynthesis protein [Vibrio crassostreae]CAK2019598.1 Lipopolysaccharide biosynthesis protein [Vibrio crassostreae]CAK2802318.1 Lipopolysaccharide biosynthesis protein [Vibrio crassostreae]